MLPEMITNAMPKAIMPMVALLRRMLNRLFQLKNVLHFMMVAAMISNMVKTMMP